MTKTVSADDQQMQRNDHIGSTIAVQAQRIGSGCKAVLPGLLRSDGHDEQKRCKTQPERHGIAVKTPSGEHNMPGRQCQYGETCECNALIPHLTEQQIEQDKRQTAQKCRHKTECKYVGAEQLCCNDI